MSRRKPETSQCVDRAIAAIADRSPRSDQRRRLLARVEGDPVLLEELALQRRALQLIAGAGGQPAPSELHHRVAPLVHQANKRRRRVVPALLGGVPLVACVAAATLAITLISAGGAVLTLEEAVALTKAPVMLPAPLQSVEQGAASRSGWRPEGESVDRISGRLVTTVFYASRDGSMVGYAIVGGSPLEIRGGTLTEHDSVVYRRLRVAGRNVTTWVQNGHTHVLSGDVVRSTLLELATLKSL